MSARSSRNRMSSQRQIGNGKIYIQIIISILIVCSFMIFKDTPLPNGNTPKDYANKILTTTVNIPEIIARFKEEAVLPAGADIIKP